jgi:hypothetical protein
MASNPLDEDARRVLEERRAKAYHFLWTQIVWLHAEWEQFRKLFAESPAVIDTLNHTAPAFFVLLKDIMWDHVLLSISRLTDPAKQGSHENLTVHSLPALTRDDEIFGHTLAGLIEKRSSTWDFARRRRDKHIAHLDRDAALTTAISLGSRNDVEGALAAFREIMSTFHDRFFGETDLRFKKHHMGGDASRLLDVLRLGLDREEAE